MRPRLAIGTSDFRKLRESGLYYVDKTALIRDLLDVPAEVVLLPRPRRFVKTLNLSMLRALFERSEEDLPPFFEGLAISGAGARYQAHRGRYPVIYLTLKGVKASRYEDCRKALELLIAREFERHAPALLSGDHFAPSERRRYEAVMNGDADLVDYWDALWQLSAHLHRAYRERVLVLIDEYDIPIQAGFSHGYQDEVFGGAGDKG